MDLRIIQELAEESDRKILLLVLDGAGGLAVEPGGPTELEAARTPNLDELAAASSCGLMDPVAPGIIPGSGPGHLGLFGYDPFRYLIGRGALSCAGVNFPMEPGDIGLRANFATVDETGAITDRRSKKDLIIFYLNTDPHIAVERINKRDIPIEPHENERDLAEIKKEFDKIVNVALQSGLEIVKIDTNDKAMEEVTSELELALNKKFFVAA